VLLEQVARALAERDEDIRFVMVVESEVAERFAGIPGVEPHTRVSDEKLRELYRSSDALFLPLAECAANNTLLEGMACGLPVIATDLPGLREYAGPAVARLVPRYDPAAAIEAIVSLSHEPQALRAWLGQNARRRACGYEAGSAAARLTGVYRSVAGAGAS
jgi:glycosyltransferase involved in cell wall biosynthesis